MSQLILLQDRLPCITYHSISQSNTNMGETISEAIAADHASFDEYADYLKTATDDAEKVRWRNQLTWTIARHALSEELTLYPAMEKHLGDEGVRLTKTDKEQHQAVGYTFDNYWCSIC
jgi:hemerythrin superfamily protein